MRTRDVAVASGLGVVPLAVHAWLVHPFIADDALISLRYSQRLLAGQGLTFTDGEHVEGYSNLLMVLLCAAVGALGIDLITAARIVGGAGAVVAVVAVAAYGSRWGRLPAATGALMLGSTLSLSVWAVGGLEQALLAGLLAAALALLLEDGAEARHQWAASALLAAVCWTRPDGPLFAGIAFVWCLGTDRRAAARVIALPAAAVLLQLGFRLAYYGDWVPNTAHIKLSLSDRRLLLRGLRYVRDGLGPMGVLVGVGLVGAWRAPRAHAALLAAVVLPWVAYVVFIGGDLFPGRRHLIAASVPLALLTPHALGTARSWLWPVGLAGAHLVAQETLDDAYHDARIERWEWDCSEIAGAVGDVFREDDPLMAVNAAGCWPYFSGLRSLDMLGLNDAHIARDSTARGRKLGHDHGDGDYVLSKEPELLMFRSWTGSSRPGYVGGRQLARSTEFRTKYRLVEFRTEGRRPVSALIWVRRDPVPDADGALDAWQLEGMSELPMVRIAPGGRTLTRLEEPGSMRVVLDEGPWTVQVEADVEVTGRVDGGRVWLEPPTGSTAWIEGVRVMRP